MDIRTILSIIPHNKHYLNRYIVFIEQCCNHNKQHKLEYSEKHHICPKSADMFPQFKSFNDNPWNCAVLSYRQHVIAHLLLMKTYSNRSQTLAVLRTAKQHHVSKIKQLKTSKSIATAKEHLSNIMKGKFTRGYNPDGTAKVSKSTKLKISKLKKELYENPENRRRQSAACSGVKRKNKNNMINYAKNRPLSHNNNIKKTMIQLYRKRREQGISLKKVRDGIYLTPIGKFTSAGPYKIYCRNSHKPFNSHQTKKNPNINKTVLGMTPAELGFSFIDKTNPLFSQYCVDLNQAHPPEPNHPLLLELNDYLLREKLLPQT